MLRVLLTLAMLAFTVYAVVDCIQTEEDRVRNLPKIAWVVLVLLFTPIGGIAWFIAGRPQRPDGQRPILPGWPGGAPGGSGPVSYTHLDVYKRQTLVSSPRATPVFRMPCANRLQPAPWASSCTRTGAPRRQPSIAACRWPMRWTYKQLSTPIR